MELVFWLLDKVFVLLMIIIGMKLFDRRMRVLIADTVKFIKGGGGGKVTWKDAAGVFLMRCAEPAADALISGLTKGGVPPGQSK